MVAPNEPVTPAASGLAPVVERNIDALVDRRRREAAARRWPERLADAVTRFSGSMTFVLIHVVLVATWVAINLGWVPGVRRFDPSFVVLAMVASVEAIFLSTFVLITQNRMAAQAEQRAELDLQVSLLAEHEITRLLELTHAVAARLGVDVARSPEIEVLKNDVAPEKVLDRIEQGG